MTSWKGHFANAANAIVRRFGAELVATSYIDLLQTRAGLRHQYSHVERALPPGASEFLRKDNPRLIQLRTANQGHPAAQVTQWNPGFILRELDLSYFRGDNAYLYQQSVASDLSYLLSAYFLMTIDRLDLFSRLSDDELFGNYVVQLNESHVVSRDLLDSIAEITFLEETLSISQIGDLEVLDIGAGYGRLAFRLATALSNLRCVWCVDGVAESTFVSDYYLGFRGVRERACALELRSVESALQDRRIHLAVNIHSFSECGVAAILWWLDLVRRHSIRFLFIVPNDERLLSTEEDRRRIDFLPHITERGYQLVSRGPKYADTSVQQHGAFPAEYYLFELKGHSR